MVIVLYVGGLIILLAGIFFYILSRMYKIKQVRHTQTPGDYGIKFAEVRIPAQNNCRLYGWWIPDNIKNTENTPTIILVHGWTRNVERTLPYIKELHASGFNMLAFDSRNHGSSDPDHHSSMLKFAGDIISSIDFVRAKQGLSASEIGVIGLSIGGAAAIYASSVDPRITSVVAVGALASPAEIMKRDMQKRHIPYFPFIMLFLAYVQKLMGVKFSDIAPVNTIAKSKAEILLIHGTEDETVPFDHAVKLKNAGDSQRVKIWALQGKGHSNCHEHPELRNNLITFLNKTLKSS